MWSKTLLHIPKGGFGNNLPILGRLRQNNNLAGKHCNFG
jgi:hypothetical protein